MSDLKNNGKSELYTGKKESFKDSLSMVAISRENFVQNIFALIIKIQEIHFAFSGILLFFRPGIRNFFEKCNPF